MGRLKLDYCAQVTGATVSTLTITAKGLKFTAEHYAHCTFGMWDPEVDDTTADDYEEPNVSAAFAYSLLQAIYTAECQLFKRANPSATIYRRAFDLVFEAAS